MNQDPVRVSGPALRWLLLGLAVFLIAAGAWYFLGKSAAAPEAAPKQAVGTFRPTTEQWANLKVAEVKTLSFRSMLVTDGGIAFNDDAMTPVFSPYSGRVTRLIAKLGDVVRKGDPLLAIEASEVVQARNDLAVAQATLATARATEKRQQELFTAGAGAEKDWRQAQSDLAAADAAEVAVRGRLRILGKSDAEIDALARSKGGVVETVVTAPISGTVTQRQVGAGQYITSAAGGAGSPVYTIGNLSTVWLVANVRETDAPGLRIGQPAEVSVLALPGRTFAGKIAWIGASIDPITHRLPVRVDVSNPDGMLKPQMFASFGIATSQAHDAPAIPESAVVHDGDAVRAYMVSADGTVTAREVKVGRQINGMLEVLDGIKAGEKIITAGTLFIDRAASAD
jgi:cobalt-zinc-cadmium efflux system membrane fusion protein